MNSVHMNSIGGEGVATEPMKIKIIPTTPEEDFAEMRRLWIAQGKRKDPPYTEKSRLKASGGEYPRKKRK